MSRAALLLNLIKALDQPFGHEGSFKLVKGAALENRFLLSLHKSAFGSDALQSLMDIAGQLSIPERFAPLIKSTLASADIVHFGFEHGTHGDLVKLYLEFATNFQDALAKHPAVLKSLPVHLALKWNPQAPSENAVAHYRCQPRLSRAEISSRLSKIYNGSEVQQSLELANTFIDRAADRIPIEELFFIEVEEEGNPRNSFDIKLYDSGLLLNSIAMDLDYLGSRFQLAKNTIEELLRANGNKELGHISGGIARNSSEFFSFYFGVEGH